MYVEGSLQSYIGDKRHNNHYHRAYTTSVYQSYVHITFVYCNAYVRVSTLLVTSLMFGISREVSFRFGIFSDIITITLVTYKL